MVKTKLRGFSPQVNYTDRIMVTENLNGVLRKSLPAVCVSV
jgi:hypothetical protein